MSDRLIYPTIDLFLYDIATGLGQSDKKVVENFKNFWQKVEPNDSRFDTVFALTQALKKSIPLLPTYTKPAFNLPFDGWLYPVKIDDTLALQVNCTYNPNLTPQDPICFQDIKDRIKSLISEPQGTLGQTWLLWGKLAEPNQIATTTAQASYEAFNPNGNWQVDCINNGKFLEAQWFEINHNSTADTNLHLMICLFPHHMDMTDIGATITKLNKELIYLFLFRSKILGSYDQSRHTEQTLLKASQHIQAISKSLHHQINQPSLDLNELQTNLALNLELLSGYSHEYTTLEQHKNSLQINLGNYQKRLETIKHLDPSLVGDLFLAEFSDFAQEKYVQQLEHDCNFFSPQLRVIENSIKTAESIIQIEQTKSDRTLQAELQKQDAREAQRNTLLAVVGAGLATGQIASSVILAKYPFPASTSQSSSSQPQIEFLTTPQFTLSMGSGISASILIWLIIWGFNKLLRPHK